MTLACEQCRALKQPERHSGKPDAVHDWIASAYPNAGKIELFARTAAPGWFAWGNQAPDHLAAE